MTDKEKAPDTTKVTLRRARVSRGVSYGPGKDVEIPTHVAKRLGLENGESTRKSRKVAKGKGRKRASAE